MEASKRSLAARWKWITYPIGSALLVWALCDVTLHTIAFFKGGPSKAELSTEASLIRMIGDIEASNREDGEPGLSTVVVGDPNITDEMLVHFQECKHIRELYLDCPLVTEAGVVLLAEMENLEVLHLEETSVTYGGKERLRKLMPKVLIK